MSTLLLTALLLFTTPLKPSYTKEEIRKEYEKIVSVGSSVYNDTAYYLFTLDTSKVSVLRPFFQDNYMLAEYLRLHYHQVVYEYHKRMKVEGTYRDLIKDSSRFADITFERFLPLISNYLSEKGSKIDDYEPWTKPVISLNKLTGHAVKFFYPDSIYTDGRIQAHMCVANNGFKGIREVRSVMIEAFCWSAIGEQVMSSQRTALKDEFDKGYALANELQLSSDTQTKLKRFQGVVWAYLSQSKVLRELLLAEYEKKKHLLTFTLKTE